MGSKSFAEYRLLKNTTSWLLEPHRGLSIEANPFLNRPNTPKSRNSRMARNSAPFPGTHSLVSGDFHRQCPPNNSSRLYPVKTPMDNPGRLHLMYSQSCKRQGACWKGSPPEKVTPSTSWQDK